MPPRLYRQAGSVLDPRGRSVLARVLSWSLTTDLRAPFTSVAIAAVCRHVEARSRGAAATCIAVGAAAVATYHRRAQRRSGGTRASMDRMRRYSDPVCIDPTRERSRWPRRSPLEAWPASTLPARPRQGQITHPFAIPPPCSRSQRAVRGAPLQGSGVSACSDGLGERAAERIAPRQLAPSRPESSPDGRIGPDDTSAPVTLLRPSRPSEPLHRSSCPASPAPRAAPPTTPRSPRSPRAASA